MASTTKDLDICATTLREPANMKRLASDLLAANTGCLQATLEALGK